MENDKNGGNFTKLKIKNYKCFRSEFAGFDEIKPINIIIGRNNSGKSSLIDMLDFISLYQNNGKNTINFPLDTTFNIKVSFDESKVKGQFPVQSRDIFNWNRWGQKISNQPIDIVFSLQNGKLKVKFDDHSLSEYLKIVSHDKRDSEDIQTVKQKIGFLLNNNSKDNSFFENKLLRRLYADRDITPEETNDQLHVLESNGAGATNVLERIYNSEKYNTHLVTKQLLGDLNKIINPDSCFEEIIIQQHSDPNDKKWEVYLREKDCGLIALSKCGSGLKTILLVLINVLIMPEVENHNISEYFFAFEELENNLHPSLLKRLFLYLQASVNEKNCHFFLTTHSNVVVDLFSSDENTQLVHVFKDSTGYHSRTIESYSDKKSLFNDLGNKASDLLQANGIIWLEGPSDRIYLNKWIEIFSSGELKEHIHYECAFFGGSVLCHFSGNEPKSQSQQIEILNINSNAILVADSDKKEWDSLIKERVERIKNELNDNAVVWITDCREIENYIPEACLEELFNKNSLPQIKRWERVLKNEKKDSYFDKKDLPAKDKVPLANEIVHTTSMNKQNLEKRFDLAKKMKQICDEIRKWNAY